MVNVGIAMPLAPMGGIPTIKQMAWLVYDIAIITHMIRFFGGGRELSSVSCTSDMFVLLQYYSGLQPF